MSDASVLLREPRRDDLAPADPAAIDLAGLLDTLARLFAAPPSPATIAAMRSPDGERFLDGLAADPALAAAVAAIRAAIASGDDVSVAARLARAYGRLFEGIGGPDTVAPYESAMTGDGRLFQAPTGAMERLLAAHDLAVAGRVEPADHLAIEVALLARLIAEDHPDRVALGARLAGWVPIFATRLTDRDGTGFFAGAAHLLAHAVARRRDGGASDVLETK